ncbi:MAG: zinc ribbon domain-containing protein [Schwartzia succinivorans]|uniref:zinc ribbon domain-containing protein n=1 Tax=Schwartzia succinivorans TaxID=55507 RepID=UPI0023520E95|nr:zinc ribbon domain-containing protein [Schwartzia succinivorans]MBE6097235.1 zinc ribbon domain-containing protein [Schwartzia succinivorans]
MARKIKFALEMKDGVKVRSNLEELRENFDLEKAVGYFLSGKLTEWLEDRYYEDEVEKLEAIDKDAPNLRGRLCEALGVECEEEAELDVEQLARLNEKKAVLRQKTGDESIIANADKTALTQEDLADLLDMDEPVIYLCGENFNVPARVKDKKYVGVLGTPTISIKANSQKELDEKGIVFENVRLPWGKQKEEETGGEKKSCPKCGAGNVATAKFCNCCGASMAAAVAEQRKSSGGKWIIPKEQMKTMFAAAFKEDFDELGADEKDTFLLMTSKVERKFVSKNLSQDQKNLALSIICNDQYKEEDLIQLRISEDMRAGWAFTNDSFCIRDYKHDDTFIIPYEDAMWVPYKSIFLGTQYDLSWIKEDGEQGGMVYLGWWLEGNEIKKYLDSLTAVFCKKKGKKVPRYSGKILDEFERNLIMAGISLEKSKTEQVKVERTATKYDEDDFDDEYSWEERNYYDEDGRKVPPAEVRRMRKKYEKMSSKELKKIWGKLTLGSDLGGMLFDILNERGDM